MKTDENVILRTLIAQIEPNDSSTEVYILHNENEFYIRASIKKYAYIVKVENIEIGFYTIDEILYFLKNYKRISETLNSLNFIGVYFREKHFVVSGLYHNPCVILNNEKHFFDDVNEAIKFIFEFEI